MSSTVTLKAVGLNTSPNQLEVPPGSLTVASNIIIRRDNVVESRRGFKYYGSAFPSINDRAKQLMSYKNRLLRHFNSSIQYDSDGQGNFLTFNGTFNEPTAGTRIKYIESNGNLYFTTLNGIQKISAFTADDFTTQSGYITPAGGIKALDLTSRLSTTFGDESGFLPQDSAVAYRIVWGTKDLNNNLILGTPSQRSEIYNSLLSLDLLDYNNILNVLDIIAPNSLIDEGDYVDTLKLPINASATQLFNLLVALAFKIDEDILYADVFAAPLQIASATISSGVATINFSSGDARDYFHSGSNILLTGFNATTGTLNVPQGITVVDPAAGAFIQFNTSATGPVTLVTPTITSYEFRAKAPTYATPTLPPTDQDLLNLQNTILAYITQLQSEPNAVIATATSTQYVQVLNVTTSANVILNITIPQSVTPDYFYQVYRSGITTATGTTVLSDLVPNDEMKLVFEDFPTAGELAAGSVTVTDVTPEAFAGAFLYSNQISGEGALQTNDVPPLAQDINRFKNYTFYANTQTRQRMLISLLGVVNMIQNYDPANPPKITITDGIFTNTYTFVLGVDQVITVTTNAASTLVQTATPGSYFTINSAGDATLYYVWYQVGLSTDPMVSGRIGIPVTVLTTDTATQVAEKTRDTLSTYITDFTASSLANVVTVNNIAEGYTGSPTAGTSGFSVSVLTPGVGENASSKQVLLSNKLSPAQAVDETARSLVRIINKNTTEGIYAYYLSSATSVPGQMLFEGRTLQTKTFYVLANNSITGKSFNPDISPSAQITSIVNSGGLALVTTSTPHGMLNQDKVVISSTDSTVNEDGLFTISYVSATSFKIPGTITVPGTKGSIIPAVDGQQSQNEQKPNRVYYSKLQQPEAVPVVNYLDVGEENKAIIRIFPLRDSLFVFKQDGLWRISGEVAPFNTSLFDSSAVLIASDSLSLANNIIYGWATQGILAVTEAGASTVTRPIDQDILKLASSSYPNFKTITWGVGYESDNSYTVYTNSSVTDTVATIGYRYSNLTNSWTTTDISATCGLIFQVDDKMYLGSGNSNFMKQERKSFTRLDYADIDFPSTLTASNLIGNIMRLADVSNIVIGDVVTQEQLLTIYEYNELLHKLDIDSGLNDSTFFSSLQAFAGDDLRVKIVALAAKLDTILGGSTYTDMIASYSGTMSSISIDNPTVITTSSPHNLVNNRYLEIFGSNSVLSIDGNYQITVTGPSTFTIPFNVKFTAGTAGNYTTIVESFTDIQASYNAMIDELNLDTGVAFSNYMRSSNTTIQEAIVTAVNPNNKQVTFNLTLDFVTGPLTFYKAIQTAYSYAPNSMQDPLSFKHWSEATIMFESKAFTNAQMLFSTDLLPQNRSVPFNGDGNGIFGHSQFGTGFFGGASHSAPIRTYLPPDCQRGRYIVASFQHGIAREKYSIFGVTLTGQSVSTRGYR